MKNSMFLMLVLLHITSQPAQRSIAFDPLVLLGAIGIASVVGFKVFSKWNTIYQSRQANVNKQDEYGFTLDEAVREDKQEAVAYLIKCRADVNKQNRNGFTPLYYAINGGNPEMVAYLIGGGADVNHQNECGFTLLHGAIICEDITTLEMMACLIGKGVDVDLQDRHGRTALSIACCNIDLVRASWLEKLRLDDIAKVLLHCGAAVGNPVRFDNDSFARWAAAGKHDNDVTRRKFAEMVSKRKKEQTEVVIHAIENYDTNIPSDMVKLIGKFVIDDSPYTITVPNTGTVPTRSDLLVGYIVSTERMRLSIEG